MQNPKEKTDKSNSGGGWSALAIILVALAVIGIFGFGPLWFPEEWKWGEKEMSILERMKFAAYVVGGMLVLRQLGISNRRASAAEKNARLVEKGNITERFKNAIEFLADKSESVQIGGIYTLYHVAKEAEEYKEAVLKILLAHLRKIMAEAKKPDNNRVVIAIWDALFVRKDEKPLFETVDLSYVNLKEIGSGEITPYFYNLSTIRSKNNLDITGAIFTHAHLNGAHLWFSICEGTIFDNASCVGTSFFGVNKFQGARFINTDLTKAKFHHSNITAQQLLRAKTLYGAKLPPNVREKIMRDRPQLLDKPSEE